MKDLISVEAKVIGGKKIDSVSARTLYLGLGLDQKNWSRWSKENIESSEFFLKDVDFIELVLMKSSICPNPPKDFAISIEFAKHLAMQARTEKSHEYRNYMIECEAKSKASFSIPDFSDPAAAAIAWAEQYRIAQAAIATKAEIGSRREATAMNTASQAVKKVNELQIQLDKSKEYSTVKRMELLHGIKFNWRLLKDAATNLGMDNIDVFDPNFGTVKAYHRDVWLEAYALDISEAELS